MLLFIFQFKGPSATSIDAEACEHDMELVGKLTANASVIHVAIFLLLFSSLLLLLENKKT